MNTENNYTETDLGNVSPNPRGEYDAAEEYEYLDCIFYQGGSYLCLAQLGATITGIPPEAGKTTGYWQAVALPGGLTPEYVAAHDRVINLAERVSADAQETREAKESAESVGLNVEELQSQAASSAEEAETSKDSAAGYAAAAETSRQAASLSEANINALVSGFDTHVAEKTTEAEEDIASARRVAVGAITAQQEESTQAVKDQTEAYTEEKKADALRAIEEKSGEYATSVAEDIQAVKTAGDNQIAAVNNAGAAQITAVNNAGTTRVSDIEDAGTTQRQDVEATGAAQVTAVTQEGATQVGNVQRAAAEIIADRDQIERNRRNLLKTAIIRKAAGKSVAMADSAETPFQGLKQFGRTTQKTTTGAQLLDLPSIQQVSDAGITMLVDESQHITIKGTVSRLNAAFKSVDVTDIIKQYENIYAYYNVIRGVYTQVLRINIQNPEGTIEGRINLPCVISYKEGYEYTLLFMTNVSEYSSIDCEIALQINSGSSALPWEPYTGGQPSPNPDYPQELVSAGDKGSSRVAIHGKNLFDYEYFFENAQFYLESEVGRLEYTVSPNTNYTLWCSVENVNDLNASVFFESGGIDFSPNTSGNGVFENKTRTITSDDNGRISVGIYTKGDKAIDVADFRSGKFKIMLNPGSTALPYEPIQYLKYSTPNGLPGIPVSSGGNYTDENGQQWIADYRDWERGVDVRMVQMETPKTTFTIFETPDAPGRYLLNNTFRNVYKNAEFSCLVTHGKYSKWANKAESWAMNITGFYYCPKEETTVEELKEKIIALINSDNPLKFVGQLATPIETPIPAEELAAYHAAHTNKPNTTITTDEGVWMEIEYATETKDYIDNEITKTAAALGGLSFGVTDNGLLRVSWEEEGN